MMQGCTATPQWLKSFGDKGADIVKCNSDFCNDFSYKFKVAARAIALCNPGEGGGIPNFLGRGCLSKNFNGTPERYQSGHGSGRFKP